MRSFERGRGWWVVAAVLAMLLVGVLIMVVANGFHGRSILRGTDALTRPIAPQPGGGGGR
ncbi:MAG TPA: hypothetical protein VMU50_22240 [Polyangia bacterium]|nr:hypothetical protein [Polyangia bacterium]